MTNPKLEQKPKIVKKLIHFVTIFHNTKTSTQPQPQPQPKPVQCAPHVMAEPNTTTTTTTTTTIHTTTPTTIDPDTSELVAASRATDKLEQNLFVIPSHNLSRCPESDTNTSDSGNINVIDKLAGDEIAPAYEPCYKPSDIFAIYQNRLCFQGKRNALHNST